ncbi:MAG: hypothetical protein R2812_02615 [Gelidibacter sp.]
MKLLFIDADYTAIFIIVLAIMFGPPILLGIIGLSYRNTNKKTAKVFYILAVTYLVLGLGFCGSMML